LVAQARKDAELLVREGSKEAEAQARHEKDTEEKKILASREAALDAARKESEARRQEKEKEIPSRAREVFMRVITVEES